MKYQEITQKIIGAAMEVHKTLGNGFQEVIYQRALEIEMHTMGLNYQREYEMDIYYKKERFSVTKETTFWLSETPNEISKGWDAACNRVCTFALFKDLKSNKSFWVSNTHLDHIGEVAKTKGIELILSKIEVVNIQKLPVIFMGDFNSEPNENRILELRKIMNDSRELSVEKPFGPFGTFNNFEYNEPSTKQIDYIFLSKNSRFIVNKYAVLTDSKNLRFPSDHFPVFVEMKFK